MNVLFLTIGKMDSIETHGIYPDLLRQFRNGGHNVYIVSPRERRTGLKTELKKENGVQILYVSIGNITKCNIIEKGISTLMIGLQIKVALKEYLPNIEFDLVMYSTPPITLAGVVEDLKNRYNTKTYLLLKDIFPQNAVDIGILGKNGIKGLLYYYFRRKEKKLYALSDYIGCMSQANKEYVLLHNPELDAERVEICPNCIEPIEISVTDDEKNSLRKKYGIPLQKTVFVYGGNLGKPQGIQFLIECLKNQKNNENSFFLIVGDGTEYTKLEAFVNREKQKNVKLMRQLPKEDYDYMIAACDVGMLFLDHRFTIPNFPSRILSYMQAQLPVLAVTDSATDVGDVIVDGDFGWWCESNSVNGFEKTILEIDLLDDKTIKSKGVKGWEFLNKYYDVTQSYNNILSHVENKNQK